MNLTLKDFNAEAELPNGIKIEYTGLRPGEKPQVVQATVIDYQQEKRMERKS